LPRIFTAKTGTAYVPFGSTSRPAGPTGGGEMHDNPEATEEEQELAQTELMDEDEEQASGYAPAEAADVKPEQQ
jgi:hypothetical protein